MRLFTSRGRSPTPVATPVTGVRRFERRDDEVVKATMAERARREIEARMAVPEPEFRESFSVS